MRWSGILLAVGIYGCAQPPTREVEMAAARLERARADGAVVHALDLFNEAETALREAEDGLSESGSYREAVRAAARACIRADEARLKAINEMSKIHRLADRLFKECQALIEEAHSMGLEQIQSEELDSYSAQVDSMQKLFEERKISEPYESAQKLKSELLYFLGRLKKQKN